jgi:hypothetical protein
MGVEAGTSLIDPLRKQPSGLLLEPLHHREIDACVSKKATKAFHLKNT